jgi:HSP20 family protein
MSGIRLNDPNTRFSREMSRLFDDVFGAPARHSDEERDSAVWAPRADVSETDAAYLVSLDLPGVPREHVTLTLDDGELRISGERAAPTAGEGENAAQYHRVERRYGKFFRSFRFKSDLDADAVSARFEHGVLTVTIPKAAERQPRRIEIE